MVATALDVASEHSMNNFNTVVELLVVLGGFRLPRTPATAMRNAHSFFRALAAGASRIARQRGRPLAKLLPTFGSRSQAGERVRARPDPRTLTDAILGARCSLTRQPETGASLYWGP